MGVKDPFDTPPNPSLINKNKHRKRCNKPCYDCFIRMLSINVDCSIRVYCNNMSVQNPDWFLETCETRLESLLWLGSLVWPDCWPD